MNTDRGPHPGRVPLPGFTEAAPAAGRASAREPSATEAADRLARTRTEGIRRVRRMSNWTAAALIVGTGAATVALANNAHPIAAPAVFSTSATTGIGNAATGAPGASGPQVSHSVATTTASGVTVTTTTHTVNGKTVVTRVRHASTNHDN